MFIHPDYVILRTMNNDHALRSEQRDGFLSAKIIEQSGRRQLHLHLRFEGRDHAFGNTGTVDLDLYLPLEELPKLIHLKDGGTRNPTARESKPSGGEKECPKLG
ncbi:MAG: hypothetical protein QXH08_06030 [Candidatus Hadarchaeales archaeon]